MTTLNEQSRHLESLVIATRRRLRRNAVLTGASVLGLAAIGWLLLASAADAVIVLPGWARWMAWVVLLGLILGILVAWVLWPAIRPMPLQRVAFAIERVLGKMNNRLVSVLDLHETSRSSTGSPADALPAEDRPFVRRLIDQTSERLRDYRVEQVADPAALRRVAVALAVAFVVAGTASLILSERLPTAMQRVILPAASIPPATGVEIAGHPGDVDVLQGEPVRLTAVIERGDVQRMSVRIRGDSGRWTTYPMERVAEGRFAFELGSVAESFDYQFVGGGTWTLPDRVTMVRRPILESVEAAVHLPPYMKRPEPRPADPGSGQISAVAGSTIRVVATLQGQANRGRIELFTARTESAEKTVDREQVWFDDELPAGAETTGTWRWTTGQVHTGERAHTFPWNREPYGFRTRIEPMTVTSDRPMFLYARVDPDDPPGQLRVTVHGKADRTATLVWGEPLDEKQKAQPDTRRLGPLPDPGRWQRLLITADDLTGGDLLAKSDEASIDVHGMGFAIDSGSVRFDRTGTLRRVTEQVETTTLESIDTIALQRDAETGKWFGDLPVERDARFRLGFTSAAGHESPTMQPVRIVATVDQPPSLVVQQPGESVTLREARPLPVVVRALDDYGIARVDLEVGPTSDRFDTSRKLSEPDEPVTNRLAMGAIDPAAHGMEPGDARFYRFVVTDLAGQSTHSPPYRFALADEQYVDAKRAQHLQKLGGLMEGLDGLLGDQSRLAETLGEALRLLPAGVRAELEDGELQLVHAEGETLDAASAREAVELWNDAMGDEQRAELAELAERVRQQSAELAERMRQAAAEARASQTSLPMEAEALADLSEQLDQLSRDASTDAESLDPATLAELAELSDDQRAAAMQQQLDALQRARQDLAENPAAAQQQMEAMLTRMRARQMQQQIDALQQHMQQQQQAMQQAAQRAEALAEQAETAEAEELGEISRETREELDPETRELLERARDLLRQQQADAAEDAGPPAPWTPPGESVERLPVERDTPAEEEQDSLDPEQLAELDKQALRERIEELEKGEDADWWDQPVDAPGDAQTAEQSERYEGRQRETEEGEADPRDPAAAATPREMLAEHNRGLAQSLTENSERMRGASSEVGRMLEQLNRAATGQASGQTAGQSGGESGSMSAEQVAQLRQMMGSAEMQQAMRMAATAARQSAGATRGAQADSAASAAAAAAAASAESAMSGGGGGGLRPGGFVIEGDLGELEVDPNQSAAVYRLPPAVRQPLLEGMSQEGPEAYQKLIDTYYRELSRRAEDQ